MSVFEVFISAIFVNNIVLAQNLGNCPYLGCSKEKGVALGMGTSVIFAASGKGLPNVLQYSSVNRNICRSIPSSRREVCIVNGSA